MGVILFIEIWMTAGEWICGETRSWVFTPQAEARCMLYI